MRRRRSRREGGGESSRHETDGGAQLPLVDERAQAEEADDRDAAPTAHVDEREHTSPQGDPLRPEVVAAPRTVADGTTDDGVDAEEQPAPADDEPPAPAGPPAVESRLGRAREAALAGDNAGAIAEYRALLIEQPRNVEVRATLGMLYESRGQSELAIEQYEALRDIDPDDVDNLIRLANALASLTRFDAAERELRRAMKLDPARPAAYSVMGVINFRRGLYAQAEQELKRAIELDEHAALAYHYRGEALNQLSRVDEALAMLERAAQLQPGHARTYYVMGILFDKKNRPQEAAAMFRKAREITAA